MPLGVPRAQGTGEPSPLQGHLHPTGQHVCTSSASRVCPLLTCASSEAGLLWDSPAPGQVEPSHTRGHHRRGGRLSNLTPGDHPATSLHGATESHGAPRAGPRQCDRVLGSHQLTTAHRTHPMPQGARRWRSPCGAIRRLPEGALVTRGLPASSCSRCCADLRSASTPADPPLASGAPG